jgi:Icc protein
MRLIQLTDSHLFAATEARLDGVATDATLRRVVAAVSQGPRTDLVVATGDLAHEGELQAYQRLADILAPLGAPIMCLPGNHDHAERMAVGLKRSGIQIGGRIGLGTWRLIGLDTLDPGREGGFLAPAELQRLEQALDADDGHWLIALHHPPVEIGSPWMDAMGLRNSTEFLAILQRYRDRVRAVLWGHIHQEFSQRWNGIELLGTPSTCIQFKPYVDRYTVDARAPGYRWLDLRPRGNFVTRVVRVA